MWHSLPDMIQVVGAHRYEVLRERLLLSLQQPGSSFWVPDTVIVPSAAIRRQLSLDMARVHGVCAQVDFCFLAQWLWQLMGRTLSGIAPQSALESSVLTWRIYDVLAQPDGVAQHPRLVAGLSSGDALQRFELSTAIAHLFETYATYRPQWLQQWQQSGKVQHETSAGSRHPDEAWQAALWQVLAQRMSLAQEHPTDTFVTWLHQAPPGALVDAFGQPLRVHVFALPTIAPQHLRVLQALGKHADITLYVINPCAHYWFDVVDPRRLVTLRLRGQAQHHEIAHPLLSTWGRQTQAHLGQLIDAVDDVQFEEVNLDEPRRSQPSLLRRWQDSILHLQVPLQFPDTWDGSDRSLEVHVCHSWVRELEVLHDRLLGLFSQDPTLTAGDVLVVVPRWSEAAPWIDAVFGTVNLQRRIPYVLTGLSPSQHDEAAQTLLMLLQWLPSHWPVSELLALMRQGPIARRLGWTDDDLRIIDDWLQAASVHWGHPSPTGVPAESPYDLYLGVQRLFLGMALPTREGMPLGVPAAAFASSLPEMPIHLWPAVSVDSSKAELLGRLWNWVSTLRKAALDMSQATTASQWIALLRTLVRHTMGQDGASSLELRTVHQAIDALEHEWQQAGWMAPEGQTTPHAPLTVEVVRQRLSQWWSQDRQGGVPTGSVTFSAMNSLRGLPFRVVCILGLQDEAFPGVSAPAEFDLMAAYPLPTDRQTRIESRNVFLDLLLNARDVVHLSYTGRQIRDNAALAPSVVISELLEFLGPVGDHVVVHHPLHPFSLAAFDASASDPRLLSFHTGYAQALSQAQSRITPDNPGCEASLTTEESLDSDEASDDDIEGPNTLPSLRHEPVFYNEPLRADSEQDSQVNRLALAQWIQFFNHPTRHWLTRRLGMQMPYREELISDHEPVWPQSRAVRTLARRLMPAILAQLPQEEIVQWARRGPEVAPGSLGDSWLHATLSSWQRIAKQLRPWLSQESYAPRPTSLRLPLAEGRSLELFHRWSDLRRDGYIAWYPGRIRPKERLGLWWHHLMLCAQLPEGVQPCTTWVDQDGVWRLRPVGDAQHLLVQAAQAWELGQQEPLVFFPYTSWAYVQAGGQADEVSPQAMSKALDAWRPGKTRPHADGADEAVVWAWRGRSEPLLEPTQQSAFAYWSASLMGPLLAHLEELEGGSSEQGPEDGEHVL